MLLSKPRAILLLIILFAATIRLYHVADLAVFLADQAADSTAILNIMQGKLTLLGPVSSVGGFFNGPIVYYLMLPVYIMFNGDPIAGTVFQTTFSLLTIPLIFLIGRKIKNEAVGLLASYLFAISPLMVDYARMGFNSLPAIFFSTLIIWLFLALTDQFTIKKIFFAGVFIGFIIQMHYLTIALFVFALLFPLIINRQLLTISYYITAVAGTILGLSPFLIFELRHGFFNINKIISYLTSPTQSTRGPFHIVEIWPALSGKLFISENTYLGLLVFLFAILMTIYGYRKKSTENKYLKILAALFVTVFIVGAVYGGKINFHYVIAYHTSLIIIFALALHRGLQGNRVLIIIASLVFLIANAPYWNIQKSSHPAQDELTIRDFKTTAQIIKKDKKTVFNVAMHAQGDNRAMPLRYILKLQGVEPLSYENYGEAKELYFLVKKQEKVTDLKMWEYTSFGKSKVINTWTINDRYFLYKLEKDT